MKRIQFEEKSKRIIDSYVDMLEVMSSDTVESGMYSEDASAFVYMQITEVSNVWELQELPFCQLVTEVFVALHSLSFPVSVVFSKDDSKLRLFMGADIRYIEALKNTLVGVLPQLRFAKNSMNNDDILMADTVLNSTTWTYGGFLKGNPTGSESFVFSNQIEKVINGMHNKRWQISIFASPLKRSESIAKHHMWLTRATECSELSEISYTDNDNLETTTYKKNYFHSEQYYKKVMEFCQKAEEGVSFGEWCVSVNFAAIGSEDAHLLGGLMTSAFFGEESTPEPIHPVYHPSGHVSRVVNCMQYTHNKFCEFPYPVYGTILTSKELAVLATPPVTDTAGLSVKQYVNFDVNRQVSGDTVIGRIIENSVESANPYSVDLNEFNRHCLVIGLTGSGKTNTIKSLICSVGKSAEKKKPFMIIEPAKKEYWELYKLGFDDLRIYSIGSNEPYAHPLCMNPFERVKYTDANGVEKSVSIQTHIDFVYAAFKASFIMYTPMPYVLEKAIYSIYEDYGWDIGGNFNKNGEDVYPTIEDLYHKIPKIVTDMGYDAKMRNDLIGSLQARINSLRMGSKGAALNVTASFPMAHLLEGNTIIEIEDIGDDDVKAFIISLLLIKVLEYRRQQEDCQLEVRHLLFIEEAHRLLKNVQSGTGESADPRGAAVDFFCNMLAEMRSKGQGFVVADQIPSKLAPDLIKNTNLKILHRTVAKEERELMGGAMNMTEEQIEAISTFKQGVAAVYSEGDNRPKLVKPPYAGAYTIPERKLLSREDVLRAISGNCIDVRGQESFRILTDTRCDFCRACKASCRRQPRDILSLVWDRESFVRFARSLNPTVIESCRVEVISNSLDNFVTGQVNTQFFDAFFAKNCLFKCLIEQWDLKSTKDIEMLREAERIYIKEILRRR